MDTEYSVNPAPRSKCPKQFAKKKYDLEELVKSLVPTEEDIREKAEKYFGMEYEEILGESSKPKKKKDKKKKKKKKKKSDLD